MSVGTFRLKMSFKEERRFRYRDAGKKWPAEEKVEKIKGFVVVVVMEDMPRE